MKLLAYSCTNSVPELIKLCLKILQKGEKIVIRTGSAQESEELSEKVWRAYTFLPHGLLGQDFESIQPVIISDRDTSRDVIINFENIHTRHNELKSEVKAFILWNCEPYDRQFTKYAQNEKGAWK